MKKTTFILSLFLALGSSKLLAQSWVNGGNSLSANGSLGTNTNYSLIFKTNSTERSRITADGLWGFGTTAPNSKLHINSITGQTPLRVQVGGSSKFTVDANGGVAVGAFVTPPSNGLHVAGNVGIGTATPEQKLHVVGNEILSTGGFAGFKFRNRGSATNADDWVWYSQDNIARFWRAGYGDILHVTPTGSVGIGTSAPEGNLHVVGNEILSTGPGAGFEFRDRGSNSSADNWVLYSQDNIARFWRANYGDIMGITSTGNVGIGTTAPGDYKLRVSHGSFGLDLHRASTGNHWELYTGLGNNLDLFYNNSFKGGFNATTGAYSQASDARLKTNIQPMPALLAKINQLKPATYEFKPGSTPAASSTQEYGFIAQEVQKIFPHLVTHHMDKDRQLDAYTVDYSGFGVLAIKGIQELQQMVQQQQQTINTLLEEVKQLKASNGGAGYKDGNSPGSSSSLEQNQPNPFNQSTTFRYTVPTGASAQIMIYEALSGALVKSVPAPASGQAELNGSDLKAGTYVYSLVVNGKQVDAKRMVLSK